MAEFIVKLGDQILQTRKFEGDLLRIGRSRENDIVLENLSVSREHAQIRFHNDQYIITDLNSANGTLVNGIKTTKVELLDEDVVTIGKHKLHFRNKVLQELGDESQSTDNLHTIMVEPKAEAWLTVESGRLKGREFKIVRFETSLGKAATNDIVITDDWLLSKKQAIILRKGNHAFEIQDLGGLRKTKVNGNPIAVNTELRSDDTIEMGGTTLVFRTSQNGAAPSARPKPDAQREAPKQTAGSLKAAPAAPKPSKPESPPHDILNDSLDLEDGFRSLRINLQAEPAPEPAPPVNVRPARTANNGTGRASSPTVTAAPSSSPFTAPPQNPALVPPVPAPERPGNFTPVESARSHMFEDQSSSTRRKRKHHLRASRAASVPNLPKQAIAPSNEKIVANPTQLPGDKEIAMWEEALKNPSPTIQRQAARTLKKLTGRDYDV